MKSIYPRYGHSLAITRGKTWSVATDKPPTCLKPFWPGDVFFACGHMRIDELNAYQMTGADTLGAFSQVKYTNQLKG